MKFKERGEIWIEIESEGIERQMLTHEQTWFTANMPSVCENFYAANRARRGY